jgi:hypothetical protein
MLCRSKISSDQFDGITVHNGCPTSFSAIGPETKGDMIPGKT